VNWQLWTTRPFAGAAIAFDFQVEHARRARLLFDDSTRGRSRCSCLRQRDGRALVFLLHQASPSAFALASIKVGVSGRAVVPGGALVEGSLLQSTLAETQNHPRWPKGVVWRRAALADAGMADGVRRRRGPGGLVDEDYVDALKARMVPSLPGMATTRLPLASSRWSRSPLTASMGRPRR